MSNKIKTVLMVDDSEIDHLTVQYTIEDYSESTRTLFAFDGREALDIIDALEEPVDLILLDINMPGMNGHEFLAEFATRDHQATVVMLTSSEQEVDKQKSSAYPFVKGFVSKPLELDDLKAVEALL